MQILNCKNLNLGLFETPKNNKIFICDISVRQVFHLWSKLTLKFIFLFSQQLITFQISTVGNTVSYLGLFIIRTLYSHYRWIKSHQINIGLLSDKEYIITSRKQFCEQYIWLIENGYEPHCLDETFVNGTFWLYYFSSKQWGS